MNIKNKLVSIVLPVLADLLNPSRCPVLAYLWQAVVFSMDFVSSGLLLQDKHGMWIVSSLAKVNPWERFLL